jgi:hypothetical protein
LALTSPTSDGLSVGTVLSRTEAKVSTVLVSRVGTENQWDGKSALKADAPQSTLCDLLTISLHLVSPFTGADELF